ncbi:hypothetical protein [Microscilla marina]|uniref:Uncharacterized protein n=1 Tax=Microscilla marina ATCC 23134 TaxID=313606 RepID=A1ZI92_MICM2|nr:hypothetical protein [Microscilla marina]EAY29760.1 hypothetical protein M23134_05632 [Microscilla marina ATCC 23134]
MFQTINPKDSKLRKLPYPYNGALSISSDIEFFSFVFFEEFMKFVNTDKQTKLGTGLNLEITSSLFFFSAYDYTFSYFKGADVNAPLSREANRIEDYLKSGWIDTNHSYGDFFQSDEFTRAHANRYYEALEKLNVTLEVFTNHGGNNGNLGNHVDMYQGDNPDSGVYHADLLQPNGVRYIWLDSGHYNIELLDKLRPIKNQVLKLLGKNSGFLMKKKQLFIPEKLRDNNAFKGFIRFRSTGKHGPDFSTLDSQLKQINWNKLYKQKGISIIYQHLGVISTSPEGVCTPATVDGIKNKENTLLAPFYFLAEESQKKNLWVCGTARLLRYVDMIESTEVIYIPNKNRHELICSEKVDLAPNAFFQGLTFYTKTNHPVQLYYKNTQLKVIKNGTDETGKHSITVPIQKLENIWK